MNRCCTTFTTVGPVQWVVVPRTLEKLPSIPMSRGLGNNAWDHGRLGKQSGTYLGTWKIVQLLWCRYLDKICSAQIPFCVNPCWGTSCVQVNETFEKEETREHVLRESEWLDHRNRQIKKEREIKLWQTRCAKRREWMKEKVKMNTRVDRNRTNGKKEKEDVLQLERGSTRKRERVSEGPKERLRVKVQKRDWEWRSIRERGSVKESEWDRKGGL